MHPVIFIFFALMIIAKTGDASKVCPPEGGKECDSLGLSTTNVQEVEKNEIGKNLSPNAVVEVRKLIEHFNMTSHFSREGGLVHASWKSNRQVVLATDAGICGVRPAGVSGYYLLQKGEINSWNRFKEEIVLFWHAGDKVKVHTIDDKGRLSTRILGDALRHDDCVFQVVFKPSMWFVMEPTDDFNYVFIGVAVFPGYKFPEDWELGKRDHLLKQYPQHKEIIEKLALP